MGRARGKMKELGEGTESPLQICGQKEVGCVCVYECVCEGQKQGLSCSQAVMVPEVRRKRRRMERKSAPTCCELRDSFLCAT